MMHLHLLHDPSLLYLSTPHHLAEYQRMPNGDLKALKEEMLKQQEKKLIYKI